MYKAADYQKNGILSPIEFRELIAAYNIIAV